MAESTIFKRQKAALSLRWEEEDKISSLPDCLLIHILSFLPTKTSVATSLLSRRWRPIWKHLSVLYFSDSHFELDYDNAESYHARFQLFKTLASSVNSVFLLRMPYKVQKMRLSCTNSLVDEEFCTSSVDTWVHSVIGPHLKELDLTLYSVYTYNFKPLIASACRNLVSLSLEGEIDFDLQCFKGIRLPSLKKLKLFMWHMAMPSINALISCFPILETLEIYISVEDYKKICVPPTLKTVKIISSILDNKPSLELSSLVFDNLNITQITFGDVGNLQNVVKASLNVFPSSSDSTLNVYLLTLLTALFGIKHLALSNSATKLILDRYTTCCRVYKHLLLRGAAILPFPEFRHLLHLELTLPCFNSNFLFSLLHKCHLLQVLIIQNDKEQSPDLSRWDPQPSVPRCIVSCLTFIQFKGYRGFSDELLFAEYMLQKGLVLKIMIIADIRTDQTKKYNIMKRLSKVSRASGMCELIFD